MTNGDDPDTAAIEPDIVAAVAAADDPVTTRGIVDAVDADERTVHYALMGLYNTGDLATTSRDDWALDDEDGWVLPDDDRARSARSAAADYSTTAVFGIAELPTEEAVGTVWVAKYREGIDPVATRVATTAQAAARLTLSLARTEPAPGETEWEAVGSNVYVLANRDEVGLERAEGNIIVSQHDLHRPDGVAGGDDT